MYPYLTQLIASSEIQNGDGRHLAFSVKSLDSCNSLRDQVKILHALDTVQVLRMLQYAVLPKSDEKSTKQILCI